MSKEVMLKNKLDELVNKYGNANDLKENITEFMEYMQKSRPDSVVRSKVEVCSLGHKEPYIVVSWIDNCNEMHIFTRNI